MSDPEYPLINGRAWDGASVKVNIGKGYFRGIQTITYGEALEPNYVYELGSSAPIAMTVGQYKPDDITFEILRQQADKVRAALNALFPSIKGWGKKPFSIRIHYDEPGNTPVTDIIVGCRVIKAAVEAKQGADAIIEKWSIRPMSLSRNNLYLYK